jgi:hypothetical protein
MAFSGRQNAENVLKGIQLPFSRGSQDMSLFGNLAALKCIPQGSWDPGLKRIWLPMHKLQHFGLLNNLCLPGLEILQNRVTTFKLTSVWPFSGLKIRYLKVHETLESSV